MLGWFKKNTPKNLSEPTSRGSRHMSRSRFVTLNSGLNKKEILHLDPYIFYRHRQYLKEIETNGAEINGHKVRLPPNYFYEFIVKYIESFKKLSKTDIPVETRRDNVKKAREIVSYMDKTYANNALLNERPILSVMLHGSFMNSRDFKLNWHKDGSREKLKPTGYSLKVDVIYITNPVLNNTTYFMNSFEKAEYDKIILDLKYSSFLNKTLQQKQIDMVTQQLRDFHTELFERRLKHHQIEKETIETKEGEIELFLKMKEKMSSLGKSMPADMEEFNNKRQKELEKMKKDFEPTIKLIKEYEKTIHNKRNKFQVFYLKKGFKLNKRLVMDNLPYPQGIFDLDNNNFFIDYIREERKETGDILRQGNNIHISMDKFINYYYDHCLVIKPENIIIIDNSCGGFEKNSKPVNKDTANKMRKVFTNKQSRAKRSLNSSKMSLGKTHKSFSLNLNKPVKHIIPLKRSNPLTNQEITNIQQSERQKQQGIMNQVEIQKELNKMKVRSRSHTRSTSHSRRSRQNRSKTLPTYPHEDVHEQLQRSLSKGSKNRASSTHGVEETKINE